MVNPVETFAKLWHEHKDVTKDEQTLLREPGVEAAFVFYPENGVSVSDYVTIQTLHYLVLSLVREHITGEVPAVVCDTLVKALLAAHGLGLRRGADKVDEQGHTKPFKSRLAQLEQIRAELKAAGLKSGNHV
jgi:hypothetical protein